jgi:hypothetical protein
VVSKFRSEKNKQARSAIERIGQVARRGQARFNSWQGKETLVAWLRAQRAHLLHREGEDRRIQARRSLKEGIAARYLPARQQVHQNGGGEHSSAAAQALERVKEAVRRKKG